MVFRLSQARISKSMDDAANILSSWLVALGDCTAGPNRRVGRHELCVSFFIVVRELLYIIVDCVCIVMHNLAKEVHDAKQSSCIGTHACDPPDPCARQESTASMRANSLSCRLNRKLVC